MTVEVTAKSREAAKEYSPRRKPWGSKTGRAKPRRGERKSYNAAFQNARRPSSEPGGQNCCPRSERTRPQWRELVSRSQRTNTV